MIKEIFLNRKKSIVLALYFVFPLLLFGPLLFRENFIATGDGMGYAVLGEMLKKCVLNGELPLWDRFQGLGLPLLANIQSKVFYIPFWIYIFLPNRLATLFLFLLHVSFTGISMYYLLVYNKMQGNIAFYGGFIWMFSNAIIFRINHINIMLALSWIPILILLVQKLCDTQRNRYAIILGLGLSMQCLAGFIQTALYCDIFIFLFFIIYSFLKKNQFKRIFMQCFLFVFVYLGVSAIQLIPLIELMMFSGRNEIDYGYFASYSIYPFQILQLFFPLISGEWARNINIVEFPTDLYIGIMPLILVIYALVYLKNKNSVRVCLFFSLITFLLACSPQLAFFGKIIYNIPLLGSFRVQGRFMPFFVFSLLTISCISLYHIIKKSDYDGLFHVCILTLFFSLVIMFCGLGLSQTKIISEELRDYYSSFSTYRNTLIMCIIYTCLCFVLKRGFHDNSKRLLNYFFVIIMLFQLWDTYFFNYDKMVDRFRLPYIVNNPSIESYLEEEAVKFVKEQPFIEQYRVYSMGDEPAGFFQSWSEYNDISVIKSYSSFDNPYYTKFMNEGNLGVFKNRDLFAEVNPTVLSLIGVKYIVLDILEEGELAVNRITGMGDTIFTLKERVNLNIGEVYSISGAFQEDCWYKVTMDYKAESGLEGISFDFYGGNGVYDSNEVTCNAMRIEQKEGQMIIYIGTESNIPRDTVLRILNFSSSDLLINKIEIEECITKRDDSYYKIVYQDDKYRIYENPEAHPILFSPKNIVGMDEVDEYIYDNQVVINFNEEAYIENSEKINMKCAETEIRDIVVRGNKVRGQVSCDGETYIIMNQNYYPGWKAYIDGIKVDIELVDSLLCGVKVPQGEHEVCFSFESTSFKIGALISGIFLVSIVCYSVLLYRKSQATAERKEVI